MLTIKSLGQQEEQNLPRTFHMASLEKNIF